MVSQLFAKFSDCISCGSSDIVAKLFYVTLPWKVIKGSGDFTKGKSSLYIPTLPKLIA